MGRDKGGRFAKAEPVNPQYLSMGKGRRSNELRILRERYELAMRSQSIGMTGQPDPMHAQRIRAAEEIAAQIEAIEEMSDAEIVAKYVPEANRPEPVTLENAGLARGAYTGTEIPPRGLNDAVYPSNWREWI